MHSLLYIQELLMFRFYILVLFILIMSLFSSEQVSTIAPDVAIEAIGTKIIATVANDDISTEDSIIEETFEDVLNEIPPTDQPQLKKLHSAWITYNNIRFAALIKAKGDTSWIENEQSFIDDYLKVSSEYIDLLNTYKQMVLTRIHNKWIQDSTYIIKRVEHGDYSFIDSGTTPITLPSNLYSELDTIMLSSKWRAYMAFKTLKKRDGFDPSSLFIVVDPVQQVLLLCKGEDSTFSIKAAYKVSTGRRGMGNRMFSGRTPVGAFKIGYIAGTGCPSDQILTSKHHGQKVKRWNHGFAYIVSRKMQLIGIDESNSNMVRRGIFIHGTNYPKKLGKKDSGGCVRMDVNQIIILSNLLMTQMENQGVMGYIIDPKDHSFNLPKQYKDKPLARKH